MTYKVRDLALNSLIEILQEANDKEQKDAFINMSLENIKKEESFLNSLIFLRKTLNTFPLDSQIKYKTGSSVVSVSQVLGEISKRIDLFDSILYNVQEYIKAAYHVKEQNQAQMPQGEKLQQ